jgi:hypothetical protein
MIFHFLYSFILLSLLIVAIFAQHILYSTYLLDFYAECICAMLVYTNDVHLFLRTIHYSTILSTFLSRVKPHSL